MALIRCPSDLLVDFVGKISRKKILAKMVAGTYAGHWI
jgi:hypothetical protein